MAQPLIGFELPAARDADSGAECHDPGVLSSTIDALGDAQSLAVALETNLEGLHQLLEELEPESHLRKRLGAGVELCRQLAYLLTGALGSYSEAARPCRPCSAVTSLRGVVNAAVREVTKQYDAQVAGQIDGELLVAIEAAPLQRALEELLTRAIEAAPAEPLELSCSCCGSHALLAIGLMNGGDAARNVGLLEGLRAFRALMLSQGGRVDVDPGVGGHMTVYLVMPIADMDGAQETASGIELASDVAMDRAGVAGEGQKRSETMMVKSDRFGTMEVEAGDMLAFPSGIIGFSKENEFVLVRKADSQMIGWLQSTRSSFLTLPVVSVHAFSPRYPDVALEDFAERAGLGSNIEDLAVLAVLSAPPNQPATVNLMAPIIVNVVTRIGAQVMLEGTRFSTREIFMLPAASPIAVDSPAPPANEAQPAHSATTAAE